MPQSRKNRMPTLAQVSNPSQYESRLFGAGLEQRRTDVEQKWPVGTQSDRRAQKASREVDGFLSNHSSNSWAPVTTMPVGVQMMKVDCLSFLYVVPHEDLLGREIQHAFARQMVPAGDRKNIANAEFQGRAGQVELRRLVLKTTRGVTTTRSGLRSRRN